MMCGASWMSSVLMAVLGFMVLRRLFWWRRAWGCGGGGWHGHRRGHHRGRWRAHGHHGPYGFGGPSGASEDDDEDAHHGHQHGHRWHWSHGMARGLFRHLDTTPGQEKVLLAELDLVMAAAEALRQESRLSREDVASFLRKGAADDAAVEGAMGRAQRKVDDARKALKDALQRVHETLDEDQREKLAALLEGGGRRGPRFWM